MTPRPTPEELAESRRKAQWFIATVPNHSIAETLRVMLRATAPITKEEAIQVIVENINTIGEWPHRDDDEKKALFAIDERWTDTWSLAIRAQFKTLAHFFGGAK